MKLELNRLNPVRTRFAPSPTGHMHAGHVVNMIYTWGVAGALGGEVLLRVEDHDQGRYRLEFEESILRDLAWLGLMPSTGAATDFESTPFRQSNNTAAYERALAHLKKSHHVYYCDCSRKALVERAGAADPGREIPYDGFCRRRNLTDAQSDDGMRPGIRVVMPDETVAFRDLLREDITQHPAGQCGDPLLRDRRGDWTYQFAVTVDDLDQGVNLVIRGADLLESTGRQILLARMLGRKTDAVFLHHALLLEDDGRKLSKRHGTPGIREARNKGVSAAVLLGRIAARCGLIEVARPLPAAELPALFSLPEHADQ